MRCTATADGASARRIAPITAGPLDPVERVPRSEHLEQDGAESEHVRAGVCRLAFDLLRRHVLQRAENEAGLSERRGGRLRRIGCRQRIVADDTGQAEIKNDGAGLREHDVAGLQIAMDDSAPMRGRYRVGHLDGPRQRLGERHRSALQPRGQRLALH